MRRLRSAIEWMLDRLWPEERIAVAYIAALAILFAVRGLPFSVVNLVGYYLLFLGTIAAMSVTPWLLTQAWRWHRGRARLRDAAGDLVVLVRSLLGLLVVLVGYTNLKSRILVLHPTLFDKQLARVDAWVHYGGGDFMGWILSTTHDPFRMAILDFVYFYAWLPLAIPFAAIFARDGGRSARRFLTALGLIYIFGGFLYVAIPSIGPAFFERDRFSHLATLFGWKTQSVMLSELLRTVERPESPAIAFFGVAAFPSLHIASTALGVIACWRRLRPLAWILVPWNLAVAWSAVAWGWHYAIDFYPGILIALGAWRLAGSLAGDRANAASARPERDRPPE